MDTILLIALAFQTPNLHMSPNKANVRTIYTDDGKELIQVDLTSSNCKNMRSIQKFGYCKSSTTCTASFSSETYSEENALKVKKAFCKKNSNLQDLAMNGKVLFSN